MLGGTRFVGEAIVRRLLADGHRVSLLNRGCTPDAFGDRVERLRVDRREPGALTRVVTAAGGHWDGVVDATAYRAGDTADAVAAFSRRCERFVHVSTGQVYLIREGYRGPAREEDDGGPIMPRPQDADDAAEWSYGVEKQGCEDALVAASQDCGFPAIRVRIPVVLGPRDPTGRLCAYVTRVRSGQPILARDGGRNLLRHVYVEDVARGIALLLGPAGAGLVGEAINLAQEETPTLADLVAVIAELCGMAAPPVVAVTAEELRTRGLGKEASPFSGRWTSVLDISRAKARLSWRPTAWRETIAQAVAGCDVRGRV